jgi:hypothetical protein
MASDGHGSSDNGTPGLRWDIKFAGGLLETIDENPFFAVAGGGRFPLETSWQWSGTGFAETSPNEFTAVVASEPDSTSPVLPSSSCPDNGL